ncbi:MAG: ABC transporter permease [Verrucomicrobiota bacterium]
MTERVGFSLARVWTIAGNTFTESVRQKVFNILLIFALVIIASASFFAEFSLGEDVAAVASYELKSIKDTCFGALSVIGMLIAIVGTAMLLPNELENRTIYTILSKPVRRFEFLLGKYFGTVLLTFVSVLLMSLMFLAVLAFKEVRLSKSAKAEVTAAGSDTEKQKAQELVVKIHDEAYDPDIVKGILLIFVKLCLLAAITLFVSTFSTSMVFNVAVALLVFFAGHLVGIAKEAWQAHTIVTYLLGVIPDLGMFNVADDIILGNVIPWPHVGKVAAYGVVYLSCVVGAAHLIFASREI